MALVLTGWLVKNTRCKKRFFITAFSIIIIFSNPFIANEVLKQWEVQPVEANHFKKPFDVGILLGGSLRYFDQQFQRPVYSQSVDRLLQTIALYKSGMIKKILLSGGSGSISRPDEKESEIILNVLKQIGIPKEDIIMENISRNTYENAIQSASLLKQDYPNGSFLLITSSFHMRRSRACFLKTGLKFDIYPVDPRAMYHGYTPENAIIPHAGALLAWDALLHEWVGMITYKIMGYV